MQILCFDIGGTAIKTQIFDKKLQPLTERIRILTPRPATPKAIFEIIHLIARENPNFDKVGAGFPGVVKKGITYTAANLDKKWVGYPFQEEMTNLLKVETRVVNDADAHGLGATRGIGVELVITLGTGIGSSLLHDGIQVPNLQLGHHPFRRGETYEEQLGKFAMEKIGKSRWNQRVKKMIRQLEPIFNYDFLFLGGGNAKRIQIELPANVRIISNECGLLGCARLWV